MSTFEYACRLRWSDQDSYGHVNNVQTLRLLEEARVALFFERARQEGIETFDGVLVVVRHEIDYLRPLHYRPTPIAIHVWVTDIRPSTVRISYSVHDDNETYAKAVTVLAAYEDAGVRRWSSAERLWLEQFRSECSRAVS